MGASCLKISSAHIEPDVPPRADEIKSKPAESGPARRKQENLDVTVSSEGETTVVSRPLTELSDGMTVVSEPVVIREDRGEKKIRTKAAPPPVEEGEGTGPSSSEEEKIEIELETHKSLYDMYASLTPTEIAGITDQSLKNLVSLVRIVEVKDGDTITVVLLLSSACVCTVDSAGAVHLPTNPISKKRLNRKAAVSVSGSSTDPSGSMMKVVIRLDRIDAAEKNTKKGPIATQVLLHWIKEVGTIVTCHFLGDEKFGRKLGVIYPPASLSSTFVFENSLNQYMLNYTDKVYGKVAVSYGGGKKSDI